MLITLASVLMMVAIACFVIEALTVTPMFARRLELMPLGLASMAGSLLFTFWA